MKRHLVGDRVSNSTRRYVLAPRSHGLTTALSREIERALETPGIKAMVTKRLPWGVIVRATPRFARLIQDDYPDLEINEEATLNVV